MFRGRPSVELLLAISLCVGLAPSAAAAQPSVEARRGLDPDSPFRLSLALDASLLVAGASLATAGLVRQHRLEPIDAGQIAALDRADVNSFDRVSTRFWSVPAQRTSDVGLALAFVAPAALFASAKVRRDAWRFTLMWAEVYIVTQGLTELSKAWASRIRPYMYNDAVPLAAKTHGHLESQGRSSFFSGHSSVSAALFFYTAAMVQAYHPRSPWSRLGWAAAAVLSTLTASMRVVGGRHYPSDVIVGHALGTLVGVSVPLLHRIGAPGRGLTITPEAGAGRLQLSVSGLLGRPS
jgi:membrane-associated phospholipid phosphatase